MLTSQIFEHFHFLRPGWGLLLLPPLLALLLQWRQDARNQAWDTIIAPHLLKALRLRQFHNRLFSPTSVAILLMVLMAVIVMGPSWRQQPSPLTRDEAALIVLLDASNSMEQQDVQPSRLARARQKVSDLLTKRRGSRTALVVYAGSAHTVLDLTDDTDILNQYLSAIDNKIMPRDGKFAEYALPLVDRIIGESTVPTTVLLITDGVSSATEAEFARWFGERPHQLLVWGIGLESSESNKALAPLETRALRALANSADGHYVALSIDKTDVSSIHRRVNAHYVVTEDSAIPWLDSGYWLVFPCMILFALWFRRGWTLQWSLATILFVGGLQPQTAAADNAWLAGLWLTPDQQGQWLLNRGDYRQAAERFADPAWKAVAYYYAEDFELAAEYFSRVDSAQARFNQANALAQHQEYLAAVRIYQQLLEDDPDNRAAAHNRQIVQDLIDAINMMSESQQAEGGSKELGEDDPRRAEGADDVTLSEAERVQFSAQEVLQDEKINEMWMRSVQRDPSHFLAVKFSMQLEQSRKQP